MAGENRTGIYPRDTRHLVLLPGRLRGDRGEDRQWPAEPDAGVSPQDDYGRGGACLGLPPIHLGAGCCDDGGVAEEGKRCAAQVEWIIDIIAGGFFLSGWALAALVIWAKAS